jgi:hypothetical protein
MTRSFFSLAWTEFNPWEDDSVGSRVLGSMTVIKEVTLEKDFHHGETESTEKEKYFCGYGAEKI